MLIITENLVCRPTVEKRKGLIAIDDRIDRCVVPRLLAAPELLMPQSQPQRTAWVSDSPVRRAT
jgi:hypothetical protein